MIKKDAIYIKKNIERKKNPFSISAVGTRCRGRRKRRNKLETLLHKRKIVDKLNKIIYELYFSFFIIQKTNIDKNLTK